jgi:PD-(D/E)XK nuclease superfamily
MPSNQEDLATFGRISDATLAGLLKSVNQALELAYQNWQELELNEAPRFRSFSFFSRREEAVSRMIAALLDPTGVHGQGSLFLDRFTANIGSEHLAELKARNVRVRSVDVEDRTAAQRRIDIVVSFENGFSLGIENKVFGAPEQDNQIADYVTELETRGPFVLLFLHPDGTKCNSLPEQQQKRLIREGTLVLKPAERFILSWLRTCSEANVCKAPSVRDFLLHFTRYLKEPPEETFMTSKDVQTSVTQNILQSAGTLESAIAVREHFEFAVQEILNGFLNTLYTRLESRLEKMEKPDFKWSLNRFRTIWPPDNTQPKTETQSGPFTDRFKLDEWRYVGFRVGDFVSVDLELGFKDPSTRHRFGVTVGVYKTGPYKNVEYPGQKHTWVKESELTANQQTRLTSKLTTLHQHAFGVLNPKSDQYDDWHWHRYLNSSFIPLSDDAVKKFYSTLHDTNDRSLDDLADFMIRLGKEASQL